MPGPRPALSFFCSIAISFGVVSCGHLPGEQPAPAIVWPIGESLLVIDSTTLRPILSSLPPREGRDERRDPRASRVVIVTTYQGSRYHPEAIRALSDDRQVMAMAAGSIARAVAAVGNGVFLDFQDAAPDDLPGIAEISRAIADSAHARSIAPIGIVVPPGDTVAYPTAILARSADFIVVRLYGEHRPGTPAGPIASPEWVTRQLGMRAVEIGVNRLVAELPLFGYRWDSAGRASPISFAEAQALVASESGSFRRDPPTGLLTASGRDGWTVWIPDAHSIEMLIRTVRKSGVNRFALSGVAGADPDVWVRLPRMIRR